VVHENDFHARAQGNDEGNQKSIGRERLRLRAAGEVLAVLRARRRQGQRQPGSVGNGSLQAAQVERAQRRSIQENIRFEHGIQKHRHQNIRRTQPVSIGISH